MKNLERFIYVFIVVCSIVYSCNVKSDVKIVTQPGDTITSIVTVDSLIPYDTIIYDIDTLWLHDTVNTHSTDTVYVYNDFFKMYNYKLDTNINDVDILVKSSITQNRLYSQSIISKNNRETVLITERNNALGIGGIVGVNVLAPSISYEFNNNQLGIGYNLLEGKVLFTYYYKTDIKKLFNFKKNE